MMRSWGESEGDGDGPAAAAVAAAGRDAGIEARCRGGRAVLANDRVQEPAEEEAADEMESARVFWRFGRLGRLVVPSEDELARCRAGGMELCGMDDSRTSMRARSSSFSFLKASRSSE